MYNLRYTLLFFISTLSSVVHTMVGINASEYYTHHTHKFLGFLGHPNPSQVPIRKMDKNDPQHKTTRKSGLSVAGYTDGSVIYLNEDFFAKNNSESINLFTCAHEAAHYMLGHSHQTRKNNIKMEKEADVHAARMLCKNGYKWVVKGEVHHLARLVQTGQGDLSDGDHPTIEEQHKYLSKVLKAYREDNALKEALEEIKDLFRQCNHLTYEQKIIIAGTLAATYMSWLFNNG
jgi:hypothetical protein